MLARLFRTARAGDAALRTAAPDIARARPEADGSRTESAPESAAWLAAKGFYAEALACVDAALARWPGDARWMFARGWVLFEWARFPEARLWLSKAAAAGLDDHLLHVRLGWTSMWTAGARAAEASMRKAVELAPGDWLGHFGLGASLQGQGRFDEAVACFERALALSPGNVDCLARLFDCNFARDRFGMAEECAKRILDVSPTNANAWSNLGIALIAQDRFAEASAAFEHGEVSDTSGGDSDPHLNYGICLRDTGRLDHAIAYYERRLPTHPSASAYAHFGHVTLAAGRLREGFAYYEFRWLLEPLLSLRLPVRKPVWSGQELAGKTIMLRCEQGVGDVIQFVRYAPMVKDLGARVVLQLRKDIGELARSFPGVDRIVAPGEPCPDFDYNVHLVSLPRVFGTDLASLPSHVPYLHAEPDRIERWKARIGTVEALKVGLVWAGDPGHLRDRYRSIPLKLLAPLATVPGVQFFSLQKGPQADQLVSAASTFASIVDLGPELHDFADTAAVLNELDLLICVDTSVAHLAGALGRPVWALIPTPCDWRWMESRDDSPWYPTMRLFRQERPGDWRHVIARLRLALEERVRGRSAVDDRHDAPLDAAHPQQPPSVAISGWPVPNLCGVAETIAGIVQYWPHEDGVGMSIEHYGEYLQLQLDTLSRWLVPGATIMEVGAGVGMHALLLASSIGASGRFYLYEDDALRRQVLRQNLAANRVGNCVLMKRRLSGSRVAAASDVPPDTETVDDLRLDRLEWLKITERQDPMLILDGAADTLWRLRPRLFAAVRSDRDVAMLAGKLKDFGYQCFRMEVPLFNPANYNRRETDIFGGRTALALLAVPEETDVDVALDHCIAL